jgi:hypothetical protein
MDSELKFTPQHKSATVKKAQALTSHEVLAELKKHGVTDLDSLVKMRLDEVKTLDTLERGSILVFRCFIVADWD